jgi:predicted O-methyltransferase YrrM
MNALRKLLIFIIKYLYALLSFIYLFVIGFIFSRNRKLIDRVCVHFGFAMARPSIPRVELSKIIDTQTPVQVIEIEGRDGNISLEELSILNLFAKVYKPDSIFEIGTFDGRTTLNLAINSHPDTKIYTLDLPENISADTALPVNPGDLGHIHGNIRGARFRDKDKDAFPEIKKIVQLFGDSATFDFSPYLNSMDMVFVDGAHSYEYVINDSKIALKMLRNGKGIIIWHDYTVLNHGVIRALNELGTRNPDLKLMHIAGTSLVCMVAK